jgi:hypothetical protein
VFDAGVACPNGQSPSAEIALFHLCPSGVAAFDNARQLKAEIMLLRLRHGPILRHQNLSERYHTQITELTATSTLTDAKYSIADSVGVRRLYQHYHRLVGWTVVPRLGGQHGVGVASISALCGYAENVRRSPGGVDWPTSALSASVLAICPDWSDVQRATYMIIPN